MVAGCCAQLAARVVVVMVKVMHHRGALAGHMLSPQHLEALPSPQEAAVLKHVPAVRVQSPKAAFPGLIGPPGDLDEAVVKREVVSQGILPSLGVMTGSLTAPVYRGAPKGEGADINTTATGSERVLSVVLELSIIHYAFSIGGLDARCIRTV
ncbi:hypothetical protein EYF80_027186 [Liparis tanakae]|uniref:Uncharacterized protein n=1 Tax=Liparis tanakae TaxID=230148 RepID=A0A4Z2H9L2_9TELE|nr:hypothetical protein EYF80_027186 [Liparis tanakae]